MVDETVVTRQSLETGTHETESNMKEGEHAL